MPGALAMLGVRTPTCRAQCLLLTHALSAGQVHGLKHRDGEWMWAGRVPGASRAAGKGSLPEGTESTRSHPSEQAWKAGDRT